jgi:heme-degrading monooxygenase HmoA
MATRKERLMYGRHTIIEGRLDRVDDLPEPQEQTIPRADEMPGLRALYCLIDRSTGRAASLSIWNTEDDLKEGEQRAADQREQAEENSGGRVVSIDRMEVVNALYERR